MTRLIVNLAACASFLASSAALAQPPEGAEPDTPQTGGWTIAVVKIGYADAEELARLLSQLVPPTVKVAAYPPTNSLVIAGDPAVVGELEKSRAHEAD